MLCGDKSSFSRLRMGASKTRLKTADTRIVPTKVTNINIVYKEKSY